MNRGKLAAAACAVVAPLVSCLPAFAGGGGQNMLLIVNPNDENSLRMANAYAAARAIPESNILFIANPTATTSGYNLNQISYTAFNNSYKTAVPAAITARGLDGQIDYIGTIGGPQVVNGSAPNSGGTTTSIKMSFNYFLSMDTMFTRGMYYPEADFRPTELFKVTPGTGTSGTLNYTRGSNSAIHWSTQRTLTGTASGNTYAQWYMSGAIGYTGEFAITADQYIAAYQRSAAADGTKPAGKVYFMENNDVRSDTREPYWPAVQKYMTANGIAWEQITQAFDGSPKNKTDVAGAVIGAANYNVPNGSTYLPGSYLDSLTSSGGSYGSSGQTKADKVLRAGAAGTAGSVSEPYAIQDRFTQSTLFVFQHEGSTLGESFFMSVKRPDLVMFQGDMLSQAYADVPTVSMSGVSSAPVSGTMSISATATLNNPSIATGIAKMELFVDGKSKGLFAGGSFNLDTTGLTDGKHEVRTVAYNNAAAESQGYSLSYITVNNKGQSVAATGASDYDATWNQVLAIPVAAIQGTGTAVGRIELRSLGRVVGTLNAATGNVSLDAIKLAFGDNTITPVAVLTDGKEVRGESIVVGRDFHKLAGKTPVAAVYRNAGFTFEYFANAAGNTMVQTSFSGTPTVIQHGTVLGFDADNNQNVPDQFKDNYQGLAVRATAKFNITTEGEYTFWFGGGRWESLQLSIDDKTLQKHELWTGSAFTSANTLTGTETSESIYLLAGEHDLQVLLANGNMNAVSNAQDTDSGMVMDFWYRGPDGDYKPMDSAMFYTAVPEPASASLLMIGTFAFLKRHKRKVA